MNFAKIDEVSEGTILIADGGFPCMSAGPKEVHQDDSGLYVECSEGRHYLDGQLEDGDEYIGLSLS